MSGSELDELVGVGLAIAVATAGLVLFAVTDFNSMGNVTENTSRFVWAFTHMIAPSSRFDIYLELLVSAFGFITVSRISLAGGIVAGFALYGITTFLIAFLTAPV